MKSFIQFVPAKTMFLIVGLLVTGWQSTIAQNTRIGQQPVNGNDQSIESTIAPYRDDVRQSVLLVSQQPQVLTSLAQQREASQQAFTTLIQSYGQTKQGWFYDLARYPDVLHALAALPAGTDESTVSSITKSLPADLQSSAWKVYRHHNADLIQVDNLNQQAQQVFDTLIEPLDTPTQQAFRQLIEMPDVLAQLTDQIDKTTRLGDAYRANPEQVTNDLTVMHDSLTTQNEKELADYQNQLNNDPQARQELQQAGQGYAKANGYGSGINPNPAWINSSYYYQNPYPFWFGYPYWYTSPLWYPSAWWYNTGFYYGPGGNMVVFGLPSMGFSNWFFAGGGVAYPHLYNRFNTYYVRNIGSHRIWTTGNTGFMTAARRAFSPTTGLNNTRSNWSGNARPINRSGGWNIVNRGTVGGTNLGGYRTQSWGGARTYSGGGFGGGGFHGGGFHGGRR